MLTLPKATSGPLAGHAVATLDMVRFADYEGRLIAAQRAGVVGYGMGCKDPRPGTGLITFTHLDCSALVRSVLEYATCGELRDMPDGSFLEDDYFERKGFKRSQYQSVFDGDGILRVCIHRPGGRGGDKTGHIWFGVHKHSFESYGGHGPGQRPLDHPWFLEHVDDVWCIGVMGNV